MCILSEAIAANSHADQRYALQRFCSQHLMRLVVGCMAKDLPQQGHDLQSMNQLVRPACKASAMWMLTCMASRVVAGCLMQPIMQCTFTSLERHAC